MYRILHALELQNYWIAGERQDRRTECGVSMELSVQYDLDTVPQQIREESR
jgi:hypothetical protein